MDEELRDWLALSRLRAQERFSPAKVFDVFGSATEIFAATSVSLERVSAPFAKAVKGFGSWDWVDKELKLVDEKGVDVITFGDARYPPLLKNICDPPCLLYSKGRGCDAGVPSVAVVGTRRPSHYGLRMAETIASDLASMGVAVVSGMARGCDAAAHRGALSAGGYTVAVLGTGVDVCYPRENRDVYDRTAEQGRLLSEFPISAPPVPYNFPQRNRIISGLSLGVLVVEAPLRSGSLMTARLALDYGREVMAVPGVAATPKGAGANRLIKDGAALIETAADVMEALGLAYAPPGEDEGKNAPAFSPDERAVWKALGAELLHIDAVAGRTGLPVVKLSAVLLGMELKGLVEQKPGKCFLRKFQGG